MSEDYYRFKTNSSLDDDGFMTIPEAATSLPFIESADCGENEEIPWYWGMLGSYILTFEFGKYKMENFQGNTSGVGVWDYLNWYILEVDEEKGQALLLADKCVAKKCFCRDDDIPRDDVVSVWEKSELRDFLNNKFYEDAFNEDEKGFIVPRNKYEDKVFILNEECVREKFRYENIRDGEIHYIDDSTGETKVLHDLIDWWVETKGSEYGHMCVVAPNGHIDTCGREMSSDIVGVRPAIWVNLRKLVEYGCKKGAVFAKLIED